MRSLRKTLRSHALLSGFLGAIVLVAVFKLLPTPPIADNMLADCLLEGLVAILGFAMIAFVAGGCAVRPSAQGLGLAFRKSAYVLVLNALLGGMMIYMKIATAESVIPGWLGAMTITVLFSLFIGMFEESIFRGFIFNGLLGEMGATFKGAIWAAAISSVLFGFIHVMFDITNPASMTPMMWAECAGKTLETGLFGFFLAAIYLKTHNIWTVVVIHAVNDFLLMASYALYGQTMGSTYVGGGSDGVSVIIYIVFSILYIPLTVSAVRIFKRTELPERGFFVDTWDTRK